MSVRLCDRVPWKRIRWMFLWLFLFTVIGTYIADVWSLRLEKTLIDGKLRYQLKARIHVGAYPATIDTRQDTTPKSNENKISIDNPIENVGKPNESIVTVHKPRIKDNIVTKPSISKKKTTVIPDHIKRLHNKTANTLLQVDDIPVVNVRGANCAAIFDNERKEINKALEYQVMYKKVMKSDERILEQAKNCDVFRRERKYVMSAVNQEEMEFPIAYSLLMFKDVDMVERLLRAIYRPQNYYCVHVDTKASPVVRQAMEAIAKCFDNVFLSSRSVDVQWAWYSVLEPEIICMQDLWKYAPKWKYFINLTGQEFPLKTNWELVRILKAYNGANDMETTIKRRNRARTFYVHTGYSQTDVKKPPPPVNVTLAKGSVHVAVQSGFVDFVLHNPSGQKFLNWVKDTGVPDETFFSSLNVSPQLGVPGASTGNKETNKDTNPFLTRFKNWGTWPFDFPCAGQRVRMVCILSVGDLSLLATRPEMFANKFYPDYHPIAYDCMEQRHYNKTRNELLGNTYFHDEFYKHLDFVKDHVKS